MAACRLEWKSRNAACAYSSPRLLGSNTTVLPDSLLTATVNTRCFCTRMATAPTPCATIISVFCALSADTLTPEYGSVPSLANRLASAMFVSSSASPGMAMAAARE